MSRTPATAAVEAIADEQVEPPDNYAEADDPDVAEVDPSGRYLRYDEILGSGASKTVYKAFDAVDGIEVAWGKVTISERTMGNPKELRRLSTEISLLRSLRHKRILRLYAAWVDSGRRTVNIVTELFSSGNLRQYRTKHKKVDMKAMRRWARQILEGLDYLHSQSPPIIHRDLKCDNIFVNGNHGKVKIGDFGLAMVMEQRKAQSIQGTIEFMAPELFTENYNELVDIYSFGICMLEMVTCEWPYSECKDLVQIYKKISEGVKPAALSKVKDVELRNFIESCLASAADRLPASELLKSRFLMEDDGGGGVEVVCDDQSAVPFITRISGLHLGDDDEPILVSLPANGAVGRVLVLRKGGFSLEGNTSGGAANPVILLMTVPAQNGKVEKVEFPFDVEKDTSMSVETEMVEQLELPRGRSAAIAELIDAFFTRVFPGCRKPCVRVGKAVVKT